MKIKAQKILLLVSDEAISALVKKLCCEFSLEIDTAEKCIDSIGYACETSWDLLIIYASDHYSFTPGACNKIKELKPCSQIIVISENTDPVFISECLHQGADDYVTIPWNDREFTARVTSTIRRHQLLFQLMKDSPNYPGAELVKAEAELAKAEPAKADPVKATPQASDESHYLNIGDIRLCPYKREVTVLSRELKLTRTEYSLLNYLMERIDRPCSSVELLNNVLGYEDENYLPSLHSHVSRLRRKINASKTTTIETIWCYGYRVLANQSAA